jgi:sugar lactone lactonase YvrE
MKSGIQRTVCMTGVFAAALAAVSLHVAGNASAENAGARKAETEQSAAGKSAKPDPAFRLEEVATSDKQWTGIAVSRSRRVFVNFPRWSHEIPMSVGELDSAGNAHPYPDEALNNWKPGEDPKGKFVCVQSVHVDARNRLWILDPASPLLRGVVENGAKLVQVDLDKNAVVRSYHFDDTVAPGESYLNDVRVDVGTETAFITDSGLGAIVVVDLTTGDARRVLADHPSTKAEDIVLEIDGRELPIRVHSDGIALDAEGGRLYFQALTGRTMYRVPTKALRDSALPAEALAAKVQRFAESGVSDGLLFGPGGIFVSALEENAIKRVDAEGNVETIVADERISWPDSFALGPDGSVWFTTSQIHLGPNPPTPYRVLRLVPVTD